VAELNVMATWQYNQHTSINKLHLPASVDIKTDDR